MSISTKMSNLSESATAELVEQIKERKTSDLLDELMLSDIIISPEGMFFQREEGHIGYDAFRGSPSLNDKTLKRMSDEIDALSFQSRQEVFQVLGTRYFPVWRELVNYRQKHTKVKVDGYIGYDKVPE